MRNIKVEDSIKSGKVLIDDVLVARYNKVRPLPTDFLRCECTFLQGNDATPEEVTEIKGYLKDIEAFANEHLEN